MKTPCLFFLRMKNGKQFLIVKYVFYVFCFKKTEKQSQKQFPNRPKLSSLVFWKNKLFIWA